MDIALFRRILSHEPTKRPVSTVLTRPALEWLALPFLLTFPLPMPFCPTLPALSTFLLSYRSVALKCGVTNATANGATTSPPLAPTLLWTVPLSMPFSSAVPALRVSLFSSCGFARECSVTSVFACSACTPPPPFLLSHVLVGYFPFVLLEA